MSTAVEWHPFPSLDWLPVRFTRRDLLVHSKVACAFQLVDVTLEPRPIPRPIAATTTEAAWGEWIASPVHAGSCARRDGAEELLQL